MADEAPRHGILARDDSVLLVVDVQARLAPHVADHEALIARALTLVRAARRLGVPCRLTEHCPGDLGAVVPQVREAFEPGEIFVKTAFGAVRHDAFPAMLRSTGRSHVVIAGMEAHVCVMQTALGLLQHAFGVTVVVDAVGSRPVRQADRVLALERMRASGAVLSGTETVLFEWLQRGDAPGFREILGDIKALP